jgi:hypothetical protein
MPPAPRLNAEFFWECPTCHRAFARPENATRCHRPPEGDLPTVAAPLVRCLDLAMFDGHPLALTGWLEADQAVIFLSGCESTKVAANYRSECERTKAHYRRSSRLGSLSAGLKIAHLANT